MHREVGALWWKWDLHVHTPCSIVNNNYGGDTEAAWDAFITDLESLPPEFKVLGINDYLFLDGYRRVVREKSRGKLSNIELLLPVIELRLDRFGGTDGKLSRVNFHAIFSDKINPDVIEAQFINALRVAARLDPNSEPFSGVVSREALKDFGDAIINSVPPSRRKDFGPPLVEGFNNLTFALDSVREVLGGTYFKNKHLTAVGKTEWWDIKWNRQSIADKKDVINGVDFVFIAAEDESHCTRARASLTDSGVNDCLLDCSDAHHLSSGVDKDRIGNCVTWLCADTEFEGLRQVLREPRNRIYLGKEPPQLRRLRSEPSVFIDSVVVDKVVNATCKNSWLDGLSLPINPGLVAIIGKKGSGKSALADTLGLLGSTDRMAHASFLNERRFRAAGLASEFSGTMTWANNDVVEGNLGEDPPQDVAPTVNFIPQDFFEAVCNELIGESEGRFDQEIKKVIFFHIPDDRRLTFNTLPDLLSYLVAEKEEELRRLRGKLSTVNEKVVHLRNLLEPAVEDELCRAFRYTREKIRALLLEKPKRVPRPTASDPNDAPITEALQERLATAENAIATATARRKELNLRLAAASKLRQRLLRLDADLKQFTEDSDEGLAALGVAVADVLTFEVRVDVLDQAIQGLVAEKSELDSRLDEEKPGELYAQLNATRLEVDEAREALEKPQRDYAEYLSAHREWETARDELYGDPERAETLRGLAARIRALDSVPAEIGSLEQTRAGLIREIHGMLSRIADVYRGVYEPVQRFIERHPVIAAESSLQFEVSIDVLRFKERFFQRIHHGRLGSFKGRAEAEQRIDAMMEPLDFNDVEDAVQFATGVLKALHFDVSKKDGPARRLSDQLLEGERAQELLDFVCGLEYLIPRYRLQLGDRPIEQLSPGEKGTLLLIFFLLVDQSNYPLIIDQPEGNLDNESIYRLLVPSILEAKQQRQIIMVTHNPNLAVVCDAEQIVTARSVLSPDVRLEYTSGAN